jgi:hypothetical protein
MGPLNAVSLTLWNRSRKIGIESLLADFKKGSRKPASGGPPDNEHKVEPMAWIFVQNRSSVVLDSAVCELRRLGFSTNVDGPLFFCGSVPEALAWCAEL